MLSTLQQLLDDKSVRYETVKHAFTATAQELAAATHISGKEIAKTCVIKLDDDEFALAVLPAPYQVDLERFAELAGAEDVELATEDEIRDRFPQCDVGAMPPFGNLFHAPVFVDERLTRDDLIAFNAGNHKEALRLSFEDFHRLVKPVVGQFSVRPAIEHLH